MSDLQERKRQVLYAVVHDFIMTASPVGSNQVAKIKGINLSPATIRTVMAELEERGFLKRPHLSSGRIPTDVGYRFYVDQLVKLTPISDKEQAEIKSRVESGNIQIDEILKDACRVVSDRANQMGLAIAPPPDERGFQHIQFCKLKGNLVLAIFVSSSGIVENKIIELREPIKQSELDRMHNYLNELLRGLTITKVRQEILLEMKREQVQYDELLSRALILGNWVLSQDHRDVHIGGQSHLCSAPEFADLEKMQQILNALEEKTLIIKMLDQCASTPGVKIFIGDEVACPEINGLTLITSVYSDSDGNCGVLGVIGPTRMNYARIIPLVEFTSKMLTNVLQEQRT